MITDGTLRSPLWPDGSTGWSVLDGDPSPPTPHRRSIWVSPYINIPQLPPDFARRMPLEREREAQGSLLVFIALFTLWLSRPREIGKNVFAWRKYFHLGTGGREIFTRDGARGAENTYITRKCYKFMNVKRKIHRGGVINVGKERKSVTHDWNSRGSEFRDRMPILANPSWRFANLSRPSRRSVNFPIVRSLHFSLFFSFNLFTRSVK